MIGGLFGIVVGPEIIEELVKRFSEKMQEVNIECILIIMRVLGFQLRKNFPLVMKNIVIFLKDRINRTISDEQLSSRVKFMFNSILAIQNNNPLKLTGYNPDLEKEFSKLFHTQLKSLDIKFGNTLHSTFQDYINHDRSGLSTYAIGKTITNEVIHQKKTKSEIMDSWNPMHLKMASKMNLKAPHQINIFCTIMSAESIDDAFVKLQDLKLSGPKRDDILYLILDCALMGKVFNLFYLELAKQYCSIHRSYQTSLKYAIWDRIRSLPTDSSVNENVINNLVSFIHKILSSKSLPIQILKIFTFEELKEKQVIIKLMKQILLKLLSNSVNSLRSLFLPLSKSTESSDSFRQSLELFILKYMNPSTESLCDDSKDIEMNKNLKENIFCVLNAMRGETNSVVSELVAN